MMPTTIPTKIKSSLLAITIACTLSLISLSIQAEPSIPLPPALSAAIQSGNPAAVSQVINTLAGGNSQRAAQLAAATIAQAEKMFAVSPKAALLIAGAVVTIVNAGTIQNAAPAQTESVLITAARMFVNPVAQKVAPDTTAQLALSTIQAASSTNNKTLSVNIANQAASTAEKILSVNPAAAVQLASAALQAVKTQSTIDANSSQVLQVAVTVSRIIANPDAQNAAPGIVAAMSVSVASLASNPVIQQAGPTVALSVLANAYTAVSSQTVSSASPDSKTSVVDILKTSAKDLVLNTTDSAWNSQVNEILNPTSYNQDRRLQDPNNQNQLNNQNLLTNQRQLQASPS